MVWDPKTIVLALTISATDKKSLQCAAVAGRGWTLSKAAR